MKCYDKKTLMKVAADRGFSTKRAVYVMVGETIGVAFETAKMKVLYGTWSKEECEAVGSRLQMSMREYCDCFMKGLFMQDKVGHWIVHVENELEHAKQKSYSPVMKSTIKKREDEFAKQFEQF